jgi:hypothetical protein
LIALLPKIYRKINTWKHLTHQERSILTRSLFVVPLITLLLKTTGLKTTQTLITRSLHLTPPHAPIPFKTTIGMVKIAIHYHKRWNNCLRQSYLIWYLLQKQGIPAQLQVGVRFDDQEFQAHAWVEYQGQVIGDHPYVQQQFTTFTQLDTHLKQLR